MGASHSTSAVVNGTVAEGYETVGEMFAENVRTGRDRNSQLCIYVKGEKVVDLYGSAEGDAAYNADSLQCVYSSSKAVSAVVIAQMADRGLLNYNVPVTNYWPEFAQNNKSHLRVEDILRHDGGMPHLDTSLKLDDLMASSLCNGVVASVLARQTPQPPKNTPREYHNLTAGWIINEVFRRQAPNSETIGSWLRSEVSKPLGADVFLGLREAELSRVSDVTGFTPIFAVLQSLLPNKLGGQVDQNILVFSKMLSSFKRRFVDDKRSRDRGYVPDVEGMGASNDNSDLTADFVTPFMYFFNCSKWREAECPHGSVHASGRGLAKIAAAMAVGGTLNGVEILSASGWNLLHSNPVVRVDASMGGCRTEFTQGGVNVFRDYEDDKFGDRILKSGRHGFVGWLGFGGSVLQWHPKMQMGFGYTCTLLTWWDVANTKARKLQKEAIRCAKILEEEKSDSRIQEIPLEIPIPSLS